MSHGPTTGVTPIEPPPFHPDPAIIGNAEGNKKIERGDQEAARDETRGDNPMPSAEKDAPPWVEGWVAAMHWLAEYKGFDGFALAEEMATRLPEGYVFPSEKEDA